MRSPKTAILKTLVSLFLLSCVLRICVNPSGGHIHRQSDTIGMSIALALQVKDQGISAISQFMMAPVVLQKGSGNGINASEFPFLNLLTLPGFLISPHVGVILGSLLVWILNLLGAAFFLPKLLQQLGYRSSKLEAIALWFCTVTLASQTVVIMPEGVAFTFVLMGIVLSTDNSWVRNFIGFLLMTLGIAMKPIVVVMLPLLLLLGNKPRSFSISVLSLAFPLYWYFIHNPYLLSISTGPQIFALPRIRPLENFSELGANGLLKLIFEQMLRGQFPYFLGPFIITLCILSKSGRLWILTALILLSQLLVVALDGTHLWQHPYYFTGVCLYSILLIAELLKHPKFREITLGIVFIGLIYELRTNVWIFSRSLVQLESTHPWELGEELNRQLPKSAKIYTDDHEFPIKLLFLGRFGENASREISEICSSTRTPHHSIVIVNRESKVTTCEIAGWQNLEISPKSPWKIFSK